MEVKNTPETTTEAKVEATPKIYKYVVHITADKLNVRSTPDASTDKNIIGLLDNGDEIETFGKENGFLKIRFGSQDAYVMASKLRRAK